MYEQFMEDQRGTRWDDPLYYIQNAISLVSDQERTGIEALTYTTALDAAGETDYNQEYISGYTNY
jgi:hypothetical protein